MAYAYRLGDARTACVRLSRADLGVGVFGARLSFALVLDQVAHPLTRAELSGDTLLIHDHLCEVERILFTALNRQVTLRVRDESGAMPDYEELVLFHHSFFAPFFDFCAAAPDEAGYPRPEPLAVFTQVHDEGPMLRFWQDHYSRLAPHARLYVIDHGSTVAARAALHPEVNVVRLPRGATDHANIARFCGHFQRFLLSQHRFVLHSDVDELLVHQEGPEALLALLEARSGPCVLAPEQAFEVLHDIRAEGPLRPGEPVGGQRSLLAPAGELYNKPVLANRPASWLQGFHLVYEEHAVRQEPGLVLLHLMGADAGLLAARNRRWNALAASAADRRICPQNRPEGGPRLKAWLLARLEAPGVAPVPEGLRNLF